MAVANVRTVDYTSFQKPKVVRKRDLGGRLISLAIESKETSPVTQPLIR